MNVQRKRIKASELKKFDIFSFKENALRDRAKYGSYANAKAFNHYPSHIYVWLGKNKFLTYDVWKKAQKHDIYDYTVNGYKNFSMFPDKLVYLIEEEELELLSLIK